MNSLFVVVQWRFVFFESPRRCALIRKFTADPCNMTHIKDLTVRAVPEHWKTARSYDDLAWSSTAQVCFVNEKWYVSFLNRFSFIE